VRLLLDSHVVLETMSARATLPSIVLAALSDQRNARFVSAATPYELEWKKAIGKLQFRHIADWPSTLRGAGYLDLPITIQHSQQAALLARHHRDPWDRMLVAQALIENLTLVTNDSKIAAYGVPTLW
jgi:PIN domain nuclease of toxin-antitoxin system